MIMAEDADVKIQFTKSSDITPGRKEVFVQRLKSDDDMAETERLLGTRQDRELSEEEKSIVDGYLKNLGECLKEIGIRNADARLPQLDQIDTPIGEGIISRSENPLGKITVRRDGERIDTDKFEADFYHFEADFYHEGSHFTTLEIYHLTESDQSGNFIVGSIDPVSGEFIPDNDLNFTEIKKAAGFQRIIPQKEIKVINEQGKDEIKIDPRHQEGVMEEGLADIMSMFCLDHEGKEISVIGTYEWETPLMMAFLDKYAEMKGIPTIEAFKAVYRAKADRDFTIYKDIISIFSNLPEDTENHLTGRERTLEMLRRMNTFRTESFKEPDGDEIATVAYLGGFYKDWYQLLDKLYDGETIHFAGMKPGYKLEKVLIRNSNS